MNMNAVSAGIERVWKDMGISMHNAVRAYEKENGYEPIEITYRGSPLFPDADAMAHYERLHPGAAERIMELFELDVQQRREELDAELERLRLQRSPTNKEFWRGLIRHWWKEFIWPIR